MASQGWSRRRVLQAAGAIFAPMPFACVWAQSEGAVRLLRAPKEALVIGNAAYRHVPALVNPANDAKAIAAVLNDAAFKVHSLIDADRAAMLEAISAYVAGVAARKSVGLFYFAGHGVQLGWRNYLLPVDAAIARLDDLPARCVDVTTLIDGIKRASNAMNVVILDACRDNPFGGEVRLEQKGLSQMDAPSATLLAYATAPGNMASDGAGANGLYTENLVREMRVPEARIEDVFKRVRLGVRLASKGAQIPWESTSLEEDFYFLPPAQLQKLSRDQEQRAYVAELELFQGARDSQDAARLGEYLRKYPSGHFTELAQLLLDRALGARGEKPVVIAAAEGNPFTQGTAKADTAFKVGDHYVYRVRELGFGGGERTSKQTVTSVSDTEVAFNGGSLIIDPLGNLIRVPDGRRYTPRQDIPLEYVVGKRWSTRFDVSGSGQGTNNMEFRIAAREKVTVPAGTFDCFRIEGHGYNDSPFRPGTVEVTLTIWRAPEVVRRPIAQESKRIFRGSPQEWNRQELVSYRET